MHGSPVLALPPQVVGDDAGDLRVKTLQRLQHCLWEEHGVRPAKQHPLVAAAV